MVFNVDILIESTNSFEKDLDKLAKSDKETAIQKINDCADLFLVQKANVYRKLCRLPLPTGLNGYESSLYKLKVTQKLRVILTVDEDPIIGQVIFTLFRVIKLLPFLIPFFGFHLVLPLKIANLVCLAEFLKKSGYLSRPFFRWVWTYFPSHILRRPDFRSA